MKPVLLLIFVFTVVACGEVYDADETPYIVSIDPSRQMFDPEVLHHYGVIPYLIRLNHNDVRTITVTFSRAPELITVGSQSYRYSNPDSWELVGRELTMKVYCFSANPSSRDYEHRIPIQWDGGGTVIRLWCEPEGRP